MSSASSEFDANDTGSAGTGNSHRPGNVGQLPPLVPASQDAKRDSNDTLRIIAMVGVIFCSFVQVFSLAQGDIYFLAAMGALLSWFFLAGQIVPLYLIFVGILLVRMAIIANYSYSAFADFGAGDFLFHLFDSVSFVGLIAFGFIHYELAPKRLFHLQPEDTANKHWHMLEPFSGLLVRLPIAVTCALLVYFLSGQIQSPIRPGILAPRFAQTYIVALILFVLVMLIRTLIDIWSWRKLSPEQARFYIANQVGLEMGEELDVVKKPAWSRIDHASAVGGMFMVQWMAAMVLSGLLVASSRFSGNAFMWPAVAALFVFLTSFYNAIRTARSNVAAEQHIITMVAFVVVAVVGFQSVSVMPVWPWRMMYFSWWMFNAAIVVRMCYLWLVDEHYARKNNWENSRPFSVVRTLLILIEGAFAGFILYIVSVEVLYQVT